LRPPGRVLALAVLLALTVSSAPFPVRALAGSPGTGVRLSLTGHCFSVRLRPTFVQVNLGYVHPQKVYKFAFKPSFSGFGGGNMGPHRAESHGIVTFPYQVPNKRTDVGLWRVSAYDGGRLVASNGFVVIQGPCISSGRAAPLTAPTPIPAPIPACTGCVAPVPRTFSALYGLMQGRWRSTRTVFLNEPLRFVVLVQSGVPSWSRLIVHLRIRRTFGQHGVRGALPQHIYRVGMTANGRIGAYTRFTVQISFHAPAMMGDLVAAFHVSNGIGYEEPGLFFSVAASGK
jgi:hypothetical protein